MEPASLIALLASVGGLAGIGAFGGETPTPDALLQKFDSLTPEQKRAELKKALENLKNTELLNQQAKQSNNKASEIAKNAERAAAEAQSNFLMARNKLSVMKRQRDDLLNALKASGDNVSINFLDEELLLRVYLLDIMTNFGVISSLSDFITTKLDVASETIQSSKYSINRKESGCPRTFIVREKGKDESKTEQKEPMWEVVLNELNTLTQLLPFTSNDVSKVILRFKLTEQGVLTIGYDDVSMYIATNVRMKNLCNDPNVTYPPLTTPLGAMTEVLSQIKYKPEVNVIKNTTESTSATQIPLAPLASGTTTAPTGTTTAPTVGSTEISVGSECTTAPAPTGTTTAPTGTTTAPTVPTPVIVGSTDISVGDACTTEPAPTVTTAPTVPTPAIVGSTDIRLGDACTTEPAPVPVPIITPPVLGSTDIKIGDACTTAAPTGTTAAPTVPTDTTAAGTGITLTPTDTTAAEETPLGEADLSEVELQRNDKEARYASLQVSGTRINGNRTFKKLIDSEIDIFDFLLLDVTTGMPTRETINNAIDLLERKINDPSRQTTAICKETFNLIKQTFYWNPSPEEIARAKSPGFQIYSSEIKKTIDAIDQRIKTYYALVIQNPGKYKIIPCFTDVLEEEADVNISPSSTGSTITSSTGTGVPGSVQPTPQQPIIRKEPSAYDSLTAASINVLEELKLANNATPDAVVKAFNDKIAAMHPGMSVDQLKSRGTNPLSTLKLLKIYDTGIMNETDPTRPKLTEYLAELNRNNPAPAPVITNVITPPPVPLPPPVTTATPEQPSEQTVELGQRVMDTVKVRRTTPTQKTQRKISGKTEQYLAQRPVLPPSTQAVRTTPVLNLPTEGEQSTFNITNPLRPQTLTTEQQNIALNQAVQETQPTAGPTTVVVPTPESVQPPAPPSVVQQRGLENYQYPKGSRGARMQKSRERTAQQGTPWRKGGSRKKTLRPRRGNTQNERRTRRSKNRANRTHKNSR